MVDFDELKERGEEVFGEWEERIRDWMETTLESLGIATKADIESLEEKIQKIEKLLSAAPKKAAPKAAKKPVAKKKKPTAKKKPAAKSK